MSNFNGVTCKKCKQKSRWVGGMAWLCPDNHRFIVDSSRPLGAGHRFIVEFNGQTTFEEWV